MCTDPATNLSFLNSLVARIDTEKPSEAHVLLLSSIAYAKLLYGDLEGTLTDMDAAWKVLDDLDGVDPVVNAAYYSVAADYYKVRLLQTIHRMYDTEILDRRKRISALTTKTLFSTSLA